ncbi:6-PhosphoFructo-2-Kinase /PFK26 [Blumeria hordei DH14]|uniref:6-PhosphoFructo-2-Kinase /PFK26 n=1 Tax=Blumeria graminis f. sp. hordei (strain DH14) TaxID=546991 RepID=N1JD45_BLUG1|nr:6-PhosphoFructo-2-Kinase /PFK26 [Blumeria hordei DH14]
MSSSSLVEEVPHRSRAPVTTQHQSHPSDPRTTTLARMTLNHNRTNSTSSNSDGNPLFLNFVFDSKQKDDSSPTSTAFEYAITYADTTNSPAINEEIFSVTTPDSPKLRPTRQNSGSTTPRVRPPATTLNIPGMTRSKISPDGKIAQRDVGAKLVVIMVGLPARGKSYITKKIRRYLSWQQHATKIFNVGNRRRIAAGAGGSTSQQTSLAAGQRPRNNRTASPNTLIDAPTQAAHILLNGVDPLEAIGEDSIRMCPVDVMEQSAEFFDPKNEQATNLREQLAMSTLDELLDFLLKENGSVGILDATNSTIERRLNLFRHIKEREPKLNILFIESVCEDEKLLEANMHLKLRGPDYRDKDPESSLADFKRRVAAYESAYVPLGSFEEKHSMQYIKMIDVGRKVVHYALQGFLANGIASYLSTFNLSPRQIWLTRHGKSVDNALGRIGGDSGLTEEGENYATALYNFVDKKRHEWEKDQKDRALDSMRLPQPGDQTPPYPELLGELEAKNFCVWTSMLQRSIQTGKEFDEDENYDVKHWEMLNELHAGSFEGMTYDHIATNYPEEFAKRSKDKLGYIYPGVGGEGYLQVIGRLRDVVREIERIKDHVLIIGHRSVCRVLMAYFMDLQREAIADLDVPLGMLFSIEPKPYGIDFHAYKYNEATFDFDELRDYKHRKTVGPGT